MRPRTAALAAATAGVLLTGPLPAATATATAAPGSAAQAGRASTVATAVTADLRLGDSGRQVVALQRRLLDLGYWLPGGTDGEFGQGTRHAVVALQKAAGLGRDGVVGARTRRALDRGTRPKASTRRGRAIEVDLSKQILMVVKDGRVLQILDTSTGTGTWYTQPDGDRAKATTPTGTFEIEWRVDDWRTSDLGRLYRPTYFHPRGIAVHGSTSVPARPASHGCVRVTLEAMDMLWRGDRTAIGRTVKVYE